MGGVEKRLWVQCGREERLGSVWEGRGKIVFSVGGRSGYRVWCGREEEGQGFNRGVRR